MNALLLSCTFGVFFVAILGLWHRFDPIVRSFFPWIPLPAFLLSLGCLIEEPLTGTSTYSSLLLGAQVGLDSIGCAFLILISGLWLISGLSSRGDVVDLEEARSFRFYFLTTFSGTAGLVVAQDAPTFYTGYALMTVGGYGLIISTRAAAAQVAGRVYIVVALIGEMLALGGLIIAASSAKTFAIVDIAESIGSSANGPLCFWLVFIGFGTKVGLVPLHFWLPRSYYWAPIPAVAVLSGAMTKAGILGWLRFLPASESQLASAIVLGAGALMVFYGVVFGILQTRAKTTLAFSSLSQMGYLTIAFATNLEPSAKAKSVSAAIVGFAFHHGLAKVVLFLGLGVLARHSSSVNLRKIIFVAFAFCSLALVGAPLTSGSIAKALLKEAGTTNGYWYAMSGTFLIIGSVGTALIMMRFLVLSYRGDLEQVQPAARIWPWVAAFILVLCSGWLLPILLEELELSAERLPTLLEQAQAFAPILIGSLVALALTRSLWLRHSHLTPRPFETFLQGIYREVWEDFPDDLNRLARSMARFFARVRISWRVGKRAKSATNFARKLQVSWVVGCTLFLAIGFALWLFIEELR